jgi:hypothetical protein
LTKEEIKNNLSVDLLLKRQELLLVDEKQILVWGCCDPWLRKPSFYFFFNAKTVGVSMFGSMKSIIENKKESLDIINHLVALNNIGIIYVMGHEGCLAYKVDGFSDDRQLSELMKTAELLQDNFVPTIPVWQGPPNADGDVAFYKVAYSSSDYIYTRALGVDNDGKIRIHMKK